VDHKVSKSRRGFGHIVHQQSKGERQSEAMKEKFNTFKGKRGLDVANISDDVVLFVKRVLACKYLRKCLKDEVSIALITSAEKCKEGVQMNWAQEKSTRVSLYLASYFDCPSRMEGTWLLPMYKNNQ
jgi:hypothetical protein